MSENPVKFLMLFPGRTGSSYLKQKLTCHGEIRMQGEILDKFLSEPSLERSIELQLEQTRTFFGYTVKPHIRAFGFKTKLYTHKWNRQGLDRLRQILCESGVSRIILLLRHNRVKQAVSALRGHMLHARLGRYHHVEGEAAVPPVSFDPVLLKKEMAIYDDWTAAVTDFARSLDQPRVEIYYEELLQDEEDVMDRLFRFLGVTPLPTKAKFIKHTPDDLSTILTNFDELCDFFRGTETERQLRERGCP